MIHHLLEPARIICKHVPALYMTSMLIAKDSQIFTAASDGSIEILELELRSPRSNLYKLTTKRSIAASRFKSMVPVTRVVKYDIVSSVEPFDVMHPLDKSQKVVALSTQSLVVLNSVEARTYYEKALSDDSSCKCGVLSIARQTHTDHVWLLRDGSIHVLYAKKTNVITSLTKHELCDLAMLHNQSMIAVGKYGGIHLIDGNQVLYSDKIQGCVSSSGIREINDTLYVLQHGTPEILRVNTDIIHGPCAFIFPVLRDNKTFEIPRSPLLPQFLPSRKYVDSILRRLVDWCSAPVEISARQSRQIVNECYYLALAIPDYVPNAICRIMETNIDRSEMSDQAIYVMLKCIQAVLRIGSKTQIARVLTMYYLGNWKHRHFVLHLLTKDSEIASIAKPLIVDALWSMPPTTELCELVDKAKETL